MTIFTRKELEKNEFSFTLDLSIKYLFNYKKFNLHVVFGLAFQTVKIQEKYSFDVNIDYIGSGASGGVNTTLIVDFEDNWVVISPHFSVTVSVDIAKWFRFPVFGIGITYNSLNKKLYIGIVAGMILRF